MSDDNELLEHIQAVLAFNGDALQQQEEASQLLDHLRWLRNACARGARFQELVATHVALQNSLHALIFASTDLTSPQVFTMAWQLLANAIVQNPVAQKAVWQCHGAAMVALYSNPELPLRRDTNIHLMILHNVLQSGAGLVTDQLALQTIVRVWQAVLAQKCHVDLDFLHFLFEHFLVQGGRTTVRCYAHLESAERIAFLDYVASYLRHDSPNGIIHTFLLQHISKEFKLKSDCVLRHTATTQQVDQLKPREAYALLRVIASASGCEQYASLYAVDHALFLNVSSLLRCIVAAGKQSTNNIFAPMHKLEEVALTSNIPSDFEAEVSFELKTLLVRCVANLLYKNQTNQGYCLDTELMPTLLECTNMDARNPLMKEWSILAIRNACIECPEIQQVIAGLTQQGTAKSDIVSELNMEMGSLRIQPNFE